MVAGQVMKGTIAALCMALVALASPAYPRAVDNEPKPDPTSGSGPSISFPGVHLSRGMPKERVLSDLAPLFRVERLEAKVVEADGVEGESYLVREKLDSDSTVGVVTFCDGKLCWASRAWAYADDERSLDLAGRLCSLIEHLERERGSGATIKTRTFVQHDVSIQNIEILFGGKEAWITIFKEREVNGDWKMREVHVDEALQEKPSVP